MNVKRLAFVALFFCLSVSLVWADTVESVLSQNIDGVEFRVIDLKRGVQTQKRYHMQTDWVKKETTADGSEIEYIAITYQVSNQNQHKKINMDSSFQFHLLDEFENQYRKIAKPDEYEEAVMFTDKHFPSIYPHETFKETIFFEAPISSSKRLTLLIKANPLGEGKIAKLIFPVNDEPTPQASQGNIVQDVLNAVKPLVSSVSQQSSSKPRMIKIIYPETGTIINRGEATQIHVEISGNPTNVIVATLGTSYYDHDPKTKNVYDVRVPFGYYTGALSVNVIAEWDDSLSEEPFVLSDSIFLDVKSPYRSLDGQDIPVFEYFN